MNLGLEKRNIYVELVSRLERSARCAGLWKPEGVGRKRTIIRQGETPKHVYVLTSGLVKLNYTTQSGDEWIKSFIVDQGLFGPTSSDSSASMAYGANSVEASTFVMLPVKWLAAEIAEDVALERLVFKFLDWVRQKKELREQALLCDGPAERYVAFKTVEPNLAARLPQADIARYLRVTPVAFSRIKRKLPDS